MNFKDAHPCELGLEKYVQRMVERLRDAIVPDDSEGEPPLLPILNRYKPIGTHGGGGLQDDAALPRDRQEPHQPGRARQPWRGRRARPSGWSRASAVAFYARNDHLGLLIPYEYMGIDHAYEPDFLVRLANGVTVVLEIKGFEDDQTKAKHNAAKRWVDGGQQLGPVGAVGVPRLPEPAVAGQGDGLPGPNGLVSASNRPDACFGGIVPARHLRCFS